MTKPYAILPNAGYESDEIAALRDEDDDPFTHCTQCGCFVAEDEVERILWVTCSDSVPYCPDCYAKIDEDEDFAEAAFEKADRTFA